MADILHLVGIQDTPEKVYAALTQQAGVQSWWSEFSELEPKVGSTANISFYGGMVAFELKIAELDANNKVVWEVVSGPPAWEDTTITFTISEGEGQTMLHFAHTGFAQTDMEFAGFNYNWGWYMTSLKFYLEKGEGMPHTAADKLPG